MLEQFLEHIGRLLPGRGIGIVLHDKGRPGTVRSAVFRGIPDRDTEALVADVAALGAGQTISSPAVSTVVPLHGRLTQVDGVLLLTGPPRGSPELTSTIELLADQIALAVEGVLLTAKLKRLARMDPLTQVHNRACFTEELAVAIRNKQGGSGVDFCILLVDVDGLKAVNDQHGHEAGDRLIVAVAELLRGVCRSGDLLVRLGGDEFVILCVGSNSESGQQLRMRIRDSESTAALRVRGPEGAPASLPIRLSIGLAGSDEAPAHAVLNLADRRMYENKREHYDSREREE
jgi:diguanylate cyclase (GGDEF)-like protein